MSQTLVMTEKRTPVIARDVIARQSRSNLRSLESKPRTEAPSEAKRKWGDKRGPSAKQSHWDSSLHSEWPYGSDCFIRTDSQWQTRFMSLRMSMTIPITPCDEFCW